MNPSYVTPTQVKHSCDIVHCLVHEWKGKGMTHSYVATCEHPTHHIKWHTYIWRTDMEKNVRDRARTRQPPPCAFCLRLLHHTTTGLVHSVDLFTARSKWPIFYQTHVENQTVTRIMCSLEKRSITFHFKCTPLKLCLSVRTWPTCWKYVSNWINISTKHVVRKWPFYATWSI